MWNHVRGLKQDGTPLGTSGSAAAANPFLLPVMDELAQMLTYIKKTGLNDSKITRIDEAIGAGGKHTDLFIKLGEGDPFFKEFKSLKQGTDGLDDGTDVMNGLINDPLKTRTQFTSQFIDGYFVKIKSLEQLEYIFEARKLSANGEAFIKAQFKDFMITKKAEIWSKMNNELKAKLFTNTYGDIDILLFNSSKIEEIVNAIVKTY